MGKIKKDSHNRRKRLKKLLQLLDSSSASEVSSNEDPGTDSNDSDIPLINLVETPSKEPQPVYSTDQGAYNILSLLSNQTSGIKGPDVHNDVADLLSGFLLNGIEKDTRNAILELYPCLGNCSALQPPTINPEIKPCLDANALKQDNFISKLQLQLAAGISALAIPLDKQYEVTRVNSTDDTRKELEKQCNLTKIFSDVFHALSVHRRYSILPFLDGGVKKILETCPIDEYLFGKSFPENLKNSNEAQRLGSTIKKKDKTPQYISSKNMHNRKANESKAGSSGTSLNSRRSQPRARMKKEEGRNRPRGAFQRR